MVTSEVFSDAWMTQVAATLERISNRSTAKEGGSMTTPARPQTRVRIEVSTSVKGIHSYSATVEIIQADGSPPDVVQDTLEESDRLVAALDVRYPKQEA